MRISLLLLILIFSSCSVKPEWIRKHKSYEEFKPDTVDFKSGSLGLAPTFFPASQTKDYFGVPFNYLDSCARHAILHRQGSVSHSCAIYDSTWSLVVYEREGQAFIERIKFKFREDTLKTPQFSFSRNTTLKDIKKQFPNSYEFLNYGLGYFEEGCPYWVILATNDELERKPFKDYITLYFDKEKFLYELEYNWNPQYSEEQLEIFERQEKERIEKIQKAANTK